ncbi:GAF domain-containing protein [Leptothoe sp. PORK10 BA2]|uniref:GAF domain-containing protein n=1 Tax=Leptothoe sp. PORK10 BA2 TaxID=3110254 RepID=UPI002B20332E|nr:GAF domain-containing protein [Leptothoe sp. PORK10 BA2]MEA5464290.1 GAF domain-containing protein [Leptothoe sp. PORK10 BA2]
MDNQSLLKEALTDELGALYQNITQLTAVKSLPEDDLQLLRGLVSVLQFASQQMSQQQASGGKLTADITALRDQVAELQQENAAYKKQLQWIQDRVALSRTSTGKMQLRASLKQTLDIAIEISGANSGSVFLLDSAKVVTECILTRSGTTERERQSLVGQVLEKGLASWVVEHRKAETIADTRLDNRWVNLPDQPYKVGSALCVPMVSGNRILGLMTLTHPEPKHFQPPIPELIGAMADQMALVLENTKFQADNQTQASLLKQHQEFCRQLLATETVGAVLLQNKKIVQINGRAAKLFGKEPDELMALPSITSVIAYEDLDRVHAAILQGCTNLQQMFAIDFGITHKSGQVIPITAQGIAMDFQAEPAVMLVMAKVDGDLFRF